MKQLETKRNLALFDCPQSKIIGQKEGIARADGSGDYFERCH
jgi:hypothetical protein